MQNLIEIKQLPIIEEKLNLIKSEVTAKTEQALQLVCTEETVKGVKKIRSDLNKEFSEFEAKRKEVKNAVMTPYEQFESIYKDCVSSVFKNADRELKGKIEYVENELKEQKKNEIKAYFNEYLQSKDIDFISFEQANINVTLSASMKSLKEQSKSFIDKIYDDLTLINTLEHKDEVMYEYKKSLNLSFAVTAVSNRCKSIEEEKARQREQVEREQAETLNNTEEESDKPLFAPIIEEEILTMSFKVTAPIRKLKELKSFMDEKGYVYDNI